MSQDYYSILEVEKNASQEDIKRAYRRLAMKYHPDRNGGDKAAEEKFKEIGTAYEVLGDEEKRRIYDQVGHEAYTSGGRAGGGAGGPGGFGGAGFDFGNVDLGDIFGDFFGGGRSQSRRNPDAPTKGPDLEYNLEITFEEAVYGTEKKIRFSHEDTCPHCNGSGGEPGAKRVTCKKCGGKGQILTSRGFFQMATTCPDCGGMGSTFDKVCTECHGRTRVKKQREIKMTIPAGVNTGSVLRSRGEGGSGRMGGPAGDFRLHIIVKPHNIFAREGDDLYCEIPVSFVTAALGGEIDVPTIYGKTQLKVPAGSQNGAEFRIAGMGVQSPVRKNTKGSLYVKIKVEVPVNLTTAQKEKLKEFDGLCNKEEHPKWKAFMDAAKNFFSSKDK